ncbi:MAG: 50S ribosomal protein L23 [Candidatus Aenigmatarchaeota archaeon]|nr:MAG: 50S ribosomal protein L23 [Candidatus Aenigmarchaeota archaeon]
MKEEEAKEKIKDPWKVLMYPQLAEKSMNMVEIENKLVFIVNKNAKKEQIKEAIEKQFNVRVIKVNVEVTRKGEKKAYVKLHPDDSAADIASRMGML